MAGRLSWSETTGHPAGAMFVPGLSQRPPLLACPAQSWGRTRRGERATSENEAGKTSCTMMLIAKESGTTKGRGTDKTQAPRTCIWSRLQAAQAGMFRVRTVRFSCCTSARSDWFSERRAGQKVEETSCELPAGNAGTVLGAVDRKHRLFALASTERV